jgi:hypothetical protein
LEKIAAAHPDDKSVKDTLTKMKEHFLDEEKVRQRQKELVRN